MSLTKREETKIKNEVTKTYKPELERRIKDCLGDETYHITAKELKEWVNETFIGEVIAREIRKKIKFETIRKEIIASGAIGTDKEVQELIYSRETFW